MILIEQTDAPTHCREAEEACLGRLGQILRQADPGDASLRRLLEDVERHDRSRMEELRRVESSGSAEELAVEAYFPSLRESLGEAPLNRDSAMYLVENLKVETWRFFRDLARLATREDAREAFTRAALDERGQVAWLRSVIL